MNDKSPTFTKEQFLSSGYDAVLKEADDPESFDTRLN